MEYGYVRVSGKSQNEERQLYAMEKAGIARERLYIDKQSGKDFNRPEYQRLLRKLREGDALFVQSIDRLGRNYEEILEHWGLLTRKKKVDIVVLDFPLLDTRGRGEDQSLTGKFLADMVLQILAYVAQKERENIRQRQAEGIAVAKASGKRWGRKKKNLPPDFPALYTAWKNGEISEGQLLEVCGMKRSTLYKRLQEKRKKSPKKCTQIDFCLLLGLCYVLRHSGGKVKYYREKRFFSFVYLSTLFWTWKSLGRLEGRACWCWECAPANTSPSDRIS